ncbi:MAG TPA: MoxR family ATPase [Solimonas sp.]|nr:MoxR family ATPase [Solimonas sp.]
MQQHTAVAGMQVIVEEFQGEGEVEGRSWSRGKDDEVPCRREEARRNQAEPKSLALGHPAAYVTGPELAAAVRTALILRKPLLLTGNPGTGKSELAERIAYEFGIGPVLRFEAQSLSEASDLFYRYDHIRQMIVAKLAERHVERADEANPENFITLGPLGEAIVRSALAAHQEIKGSPAGQGRPADRQGLLNSADASLYQRLLADGPDPVGRRSVVLIDEIDKASRDFPNDLLNGIARMQFEIVELGRRLIKGADLNQRPHLHPIVVITSNSERDLPPPFLRRCVFCHVPDPTRQQLAAIVRRRVFQDYDTDPKPEESDRLPPLYSRLLGAFMRVRDSNKDALRYQVSTSELMDFMTAARHQGLDGRDLASADKDKLLSVISALAKHQDDVPQLRKLLELELASPIPASGT